MQSQVPAFFEGDAAEVWCGVCEPDDDDVDYPCTRCLQNRLYRLPEQISGNDEIDQFLRDAREDVINGNRDVDNLMELIPFSDFSDITFLAQGGFGEVYKATWKKGNILEWSNKRMDFVRKGDNLYEATMVVLKVHISDSGFIHEVS